MREEYFKNIVSNDVWVGGECYAIDKTSGATLLGLAKSVYVLNGKLLSPWSVTIS